MRATYDTNEARSEAGLATHKSAIKNNRWAARLATACLWIACYSFPAAMTLTAAHTDWKAAGRRWWSHVQYLASDELAGRDTGSEGYFQAADYVARQFADAGLTPAGTNGFFQDITFDVKQIDEEHSSLSLVSADGSVQPLALGEDVILSARSNAESPVEFPAAFVGYGFAVPEKQLTNSPASTCTAKSRCISRAARIRCRKI